MFVPSIFTVSFSNKLLKFMNQVSEYKLCDSHPKISLQLITFHLNVKINKIINKTVSYFFHIGY